MKTEKHEKNEENNGAEDSGQPIDLAQKRQDAKRYERVRTTFESMLQEAEQGFQVSISRIKPTWASGWLETIEIDTDEDGRPPVDMEYIKDAWGGGQYVVRLLNSRGGFVLSKTVRIAGEPMENASIIDSPSVKKAKEEKMLFEIRAQETKSKSKDSDMMTLLLNATQKSNRDSMEMMRENYTRQAPSPMGQLSEMMGLFQVFEKMKGTEPAPVKSDELTSMITGFMDILKAKQGQPAPTKSAIMPRRKTIPLGYPGEIYQKQSELNLGETNGTGSNIINDNIDIANDDNISNGDDFVSSQEENKKVEGPESLAREDEEVQISLAQEISEMDPSDIALTMAESLGLMTDEKQKEVFSRFQTIGEDEKKE